MMMPPKALTTICRETSRVLERKGLGPLSTGELLKFFGVLVLGTKFEFSDRRSLWSTTAPSKYIPAPHFGRTGMSRNRFDHIFANLRTGPQPNVRPQEMSSEQYRWMLVDTFVNNFNEHRAQFFSPSDLICVDESISRWYGQGGYWINHGLHMYVAIDRKPENGCEIQNSACGRSGVMLWLKLVKYEEDENTHAQEDTVGMTHGAKVLKSLVKKGIMSSHEPFDDF